MKPESARYLLNAILTKHGPGAFNDLALAAFLADTVTEREEEGQDPVELLRDWCHDLAEQLESCL